jgi:hypothetical protein
MSVKHNYIFTAYTWYRLSIIDYMFRSFIDHHQVKVIINTTAWKELNKIVLNRILPQ